MSKELEILGPIEALDKLLEGYSKGMAGRSYYDIVREALQRPEAIETANPSKALKTLDVLDKIISPLLEPVLAEYEDDLSDKITANYFALKQSLLKAREQEKENELLKEIIKRFFDRGCPLHQYTDKAGILQIEVDAECSTMHLGKFKDVDLDEKLKEVLE